MDAQRDAARAFEEGIAVRVELGGIELNFMRRAGEMNKRNEARIDRKGESGDDLGIDHFGVS